ncbi:MAG: CBS domain-containing protein [Steroidobacteraceae bacterium]
MLLKDLCTPDVVACVPDASALHAARLMRQHHVGDVVVVENTDTDPTPIGVVTDRDIVIEVLGKELDPARVTLRQIMRTPAVIASTSEGIAQAIERMKTHGVRRIPVVDETSKLVGILCLDDLLKRLAADAVALAEVIAREQDREHRTRR